MGHWHYSDLLTGGQTAVNLHLRGPRIPGPWVAAMPRDPPMLGVVTAQARGSQPGGRPLGWTGRHLPRSRAEWPGLSPAT